MAKTNRTDLNAPPLSSRISAIEMSLNALEGRIAVLVESPNNEKLFRKFMDKKHKFFPQNGKSNIIELVKIFNQKEKFVVIGIADADFDRMLGKLLVESNLFFADFHDTEMMMFSSKEVFENVLNQYKNPDKLEKFEAEKRVDFAEYLLHLLKHIAILRLLNHLESLSLTFKTEIKGRFKYIDYESFIDDKNLEINISNLIKEVENKSVKPNFFKQNPLLKEKFDKLLSEEYDMIELCNGHDLMNVIALSLSKVIGNYSSSSKLSDTEIENSFILSYRLSDFEKTNLYQNLKEWQNKNGKILLIEPNL
jgi:hypothetical protein